MEEKTILVQGIKGDAESGDDTTLPINGIVAFDGDEIPEGYELYQEGAQE